jgi:hypothetical protein
MLATTTLLTPTSVLSLAGRPDAHFDRDVQQLADARAHEQLGCQPSTFERLQALFTRTTPVPADCGCAA